MASQSFQALGDIYPRRFVKILAAGGDDSVVACGSNEQADGISQEYSHDAPIPSASTLAAASGDHLKVYLPGGPEKDVLLELGGTVARGERIVSGAAGVGVAMGSTAATKYNVGAIASESGVSGDFIRVRVHVEAVTFPA